MATLVGLYLRRRSVRGRLVAVDRRRGVDAPDDLALQRRLDDRRLLPGLRRHLRVGGVRREVEELVLALAPDVQAVRDAAELLAPRADEGALLVEDDDGVGALARRVDGVVHVHVPLRVLHDAVRVAPRQPCRQPAPVVVGLVGVGAGAHDRLLRPGLVLEAQQDGRDERRRGGCVEELASGAGHVAACGGGLAAFDGRFIPPLCVARRSNIPHILTPLALIGGRLARLGAAPNLHRRPQILRRRAPGAACRSRRA